MRSTKRRLWAASASAGEALNDVHGGGCRYKEAEAVLGKAVEIKERLLGSAHPLLATTLASLADVYLNWGGSLGLDGRDKVPCCALPHY
jgi:hypothetical protein